MITDTTQGVTLVGGGEVDRSDMRAALALAPILVAADGGAEAALDAGYTPTAVIGDFDSFSPDLQPHIPAARMHHIPEQETTDFHKALRSISAPFLLGVGFLGRRVDHELASLNTLIKLQEKRCILIGQRDIIWAARTETTLDLPIGTRLSLFPMGPVTGRSEGLEWPIESIHFSPANRIGTSNRTTGQVRLEFDQSGMLIILPKAHLKMAIAALNSPAK
ncbi:MAG: thiamine diphosphokinase [Pseudomonadota bacterium]